MIVQTYYCDRCGELLGSTCLRISFASMKKRDDEWLFAETGLQKPTELCDSCKADFLRWLRKE